MRLTRTYLRGLVLAVSLVLIVKALGVDLDGARFWVFYLSAVAGGCALFWERGNP